MDDYSLGFLFSIFCFKAISRLEEQDLITIAPTCGVVKRLENICSCNYNS
ncbi:hypothetical protein EW15_1295 [Prochlorococcus sp. MIT 0801]|nr:hypothetical protein EW15_1295 [Prochlorococcus sp. MIT 0801]